MISKKLSGGTDYLNRLTLPEGQLAVDTEREALRVYDGVLQGGYEVLGTRDYLPPMPGPQALLAGDETTGFYGEVSPEEFISYGELSSSVGASMGSLVNNEISIWLKFSMGGLPAYIPKKPIREKISWDYLNVLGLVFGESTVTIKNGVFQVRLMTGIINPDIWEVGGEWNRLMYPIHVDDPNGQEWGIGYTHDDLHYSNGIRGDNTWCQETNPNALERRVCRGRGGVTTLSNVLSSGDAVSYGWRPILIPVL